MGRPTPPAPIASLRRPELVLVLLVTFLALPAIPTRELMPTDEPRFALVARQMVEDPAPIVPHLGYDPLTRAGETYGDKPPVFFWLVSLFSLLTGGVNEISARLPSFLAAIAAVLLTRRLGRLLIDERTGFAAAAILATSSQFFLRAGWCSIDMLLTAVVLAATDCWLRAARAVGGGREGRERSLRDGDERSVRDGGERSVRDGGERASADRGERSVADRDDGRGRPFRLAALGGLFAAAATLSKGPVGLIFPLAFLAGDRLVARWPKRVLQPGSARITLPPTAPETTPVDSQGTIARSAATPRPSDLVAGPWGDGEHSEASARSRSAAPLRAALLGGVCYLLPILAWVVAIALVGGTGYVREILFRQNVTRYVAAWNNEQPWYYYLYRLPIGLFPWTLLLPAAILAPRGAPERASRSLRGLLVACGALFVFFSISTGKRGVYLLPLYPALAILIAAGWMRAASRPFRSIAAAHAALLAAAGIAAAVALPIVASRKVPDLTVAAAFLGLISAAATSLAAIFFFKARVDTSLHVLVGGVAILVFSASILLVPWANRRSGLSDFGARLAASTTKDDYLVVDREGYEQILFYSHLKGARRDFEHTRVSVENGSIVLASNAGPISPQPAIAPNTLPDASRSNAAPPNAAAPGAASSDTAPHSATRSDAASPENAVPGATPPESAPPEAAPPDAARPITVPSIAVPLSEAERAARTVRFPAAARVVFVVRGRRAARIREAIGPTARVLFSAPLSDEPYLAIASR